MLIRKFTGKNVERLYQWEVRAFVSSERTITAYRQCSWSNGKEAIWLCCDKVRVLRAWLQYDFLSNSNNIVGSIVIYVLTHGLLQTVRYWIQRSLIMWSPHVDASTAMCFEGQGATLRSAGKILPIELSKNANPSRINSARCRATLSQIWVLSVRRWRWKETNSSIDSSCLVAVCKCSSFLQLMW